MLVGTIQRWNSKHKFGFIAPDEGQGRVSEVFFHASACDFEPDRGIRVTFELGERDGKTVAKNVRHRAGNHAAWAPGVLKTIGASEQERRAARRAAAENLFNKKTA